MTSFVNLQLQELEVLSEAYVNKALDQEYSTNLDVSRVRFLGIEMAIRKEWIYEAANTETPKQIGSNTSFEDNNCQTVIVKDNTKSDFEQKDCVSNTLNKHTNNLNRVDLVWQRVMSDLQNDCIENDADNSVMPDIVRASETISDGQCDISNVNRLQHTTYAYSPSHTYSVERAFRKLRLSFDRKRNADEYAMEDSINKIRNDKAQEVILDNMHGQLEFAFDDSFEFAPASNESVIKQEIHNKVTCEKHNTKQSTEQNSPYKKVTPHPINLSESTTMPEECTCVCCNQTSRILSNSSAPDENLTDSLKSLCNDCLANEHDTLLQELEKSSSPSRNSKRRLRLSSRRSRKSISSSSTSSIAPSSMSQPLSPTESTGSTKSRTSSASVKSVGSPISALEESSSQSTQCSADAVFSLMHPMNKIICNRLKQWKKRPKRKFKLSHLLSCASAQS